MKEYITDAIVLGTKPVRESDKTVALFTKELGRVEVKVVAARKTLSKFTPHLDPLNLVHVRLVKKNNFTLTDVLTENRFAPIRESTRIFGAALQLISLLDELLAVSQPEPRLWHALVRALEEGKINIPLFLKLLGYDPLYASCARCHARHISAFLRKEQAFLCSNCARAFPESEIILIH